MKFAGAWNVGGFCGPSRSFFPQDAPLEGSREPGPGPSVAAKLAATAVDPCGSR